MEPKRLRNTQNRLKTNRGPGLNFHEKGLLNFGFILKKMKRKIDEEPFLKWGPWAAALNARA